MSVWHSARKLVAVLTIGFCASCSNPDTRIVNLDGLDLPSDLPPPAIGGSAGEVVDGLCSWTEAHQVPFARQDIVSVRVRETQTSGPVNYGYRSLLEGFLASGVYPSRILARGDPRTLIGDSALLRPLSRFLISNGDWVLEKVVQGYCVGGGEGAVQILDQCVSVRRLHDDAGEWIDADYRSIQFQVDVGIGSKQEMSISVLSLYRGDRLLGRSIRTNAYAGPWDLGRISRSCTRHFLPERFDSFDPS